MSAPPVLKKPKLEIEEHEAEAAAVPEPNGEIEEIADADDDDADDGGMDEDSLKEQEEALVALFDHRSKEVEHLRKRLSYYKSELDKAERRVQEIQCKLARLRGRRNAKLSKKSSKDSTEDIKVGRHSASPVQNCHDSAERQPQNIAKISTKSFENCRGNGIKDIKLERRSTSPFKITEGSSQSQSQSRPQLVIPSVKSKISQPMRKESGTQVSNVSGPQPNASMSTHVNSRDKCQKLFSEQNAAETQSKRTKRKMERNEHKELIPLIRTSSSPCTMFCETGCLISSQHKRKLRSLVLCPTNEQLFLTSALDGVVNLWQVQSKGSRACLLSTTDCVSVKQRRWPEDIAWHPDGDSLFLIYTADEGDSQVSILDLNKAKGGNRVKFLEYRPHVRGIINGIMFMPWDDSCFVTGGSDHAVVCWTATDGENLWKPKSLHRTMHSSAVMGVAGMQQKHIVLSAGADKRIIGFDVLAGRADYTHQIESKCMSVLTNPCDFNLFMVQTGTPERQLRLFDIRLRRTEIHAFGWRQESSESQSALINQSWSPNGLYITSGSADPVIHLFDIRYNAQKPSQSISAHQKRVFKAVWHQTMPLLISISSDLNIGLHNIK